MLGSVLAIGRYVMMICIYVGVGCIIYSIFTIQHPKGPEYTIPISPTMQCVINLTFQFFFVYIWIWAAITVKDFELKVKIQLSKELLRLLILFPNFSLFAVGHLLAKMENRKSAPDQLLCPRLWPLQVVPFAMSVPNTMPFRSLSITSRCWQLFSIRW